MKTVIIHCQSHRGSTYHIARQLTEKIGGEITEFFLPRDFGEFCCGCTQCIVKGAESARTIRFSPLSPKRWTKRMKSCAIIILNGRSSRFNSKKAEGC